MGLSNAQKDITTMKFIKGRWFPLIVATLLIAIGGGAMYLFGWRVTYLPELENSWDAVSAVAAWGGVIVAIASTTASFLAVWFAIQVPKKIAEQQNKIALFEKRYQVYTSTMKMFRSPTKFYCPKVMMLMEQRIISTTFPVHAGIFQ